MKTATIELKKNHEHIIGHREFKEEYELEFLENMARKDIQEAIEEFEDGKIPAQIDDEDREEIDNLKELNEGDYSLNVGDYTYYINIE